MMMMIVQMMFSFMNSIRMYRKSILPLFLLLIVASLVNSATNYEQLARHKFQELPVAANWAPPSPRHSLEAQSHAGAVLPANNHQDATTTNQHQRQPVWHHTNDEPTPARSNANANHQVDQLAASASSSHATGAFLMPTNLELALRQASGDESVFQPSAPIGPLLGHSSNHHAHGPYDWHPSPTGSKQRERLVDRPATSTGPPPAVTTSMTTTPATTQSVQTTTTTSTTTTTTTELNNQLEPLVLSHQQSVFSHQKEFQAVNGTLLEFNNQVIYEGPATAPSSANSDDYYFSTSSPMGGGGGGGGGNESVQHHLPTSNSWWALGIGEEFERINNLTRDNYLAYCEHSTLLVDGKQRSLCRMHPRVMAVVARGLKMAIDECQAKFATSRWNCSLVVHEALNNPHRPHDEDNLVQGGGDGGQSTIFGDVMRRPNRERSFLNAVIAAGLAHAMTKACSQGELPEECSCDRKIKSKSNKGRIEWVACSDDIDYGARFSRDFTDNFDPTESDATSTIYMHNSEVGRRVFKSATDITCTCLNGDNMAASAGSCQTKRCWKHLGSFSDIADELIKRYEGATHVQRSNKDPHKLRPVRRGVRRPKRKDLVYIDESPDYCQRDTRIGVLGTQNRVCNSTSQGPDSCSLLCCGRGFQTVVEHIEEDCNCKFVWCCQVKCDKCKRFVSNDVCN